MANSVSLDGYLHIEGFERFDDLAFDRRKIRAAMRKAGRLVVQKAQMNLALGGGQDGYPTSRTGATVDAIKAKLSRSGFLVRVAPAKTSAMKAYYPAYLHYGVKQGKRLGKLAPGQGRGKSNRRANGVRARALADRAAGGWRITPRENYMTDALQDSKAQVQRLLSAAFASALLSSV
ncbi:hypothetical protein [Pseudomonas aegrilactucae]|uniref:Uncharacterized protein n=1 Tax=Pseudomonas aegrilactucae TaxID=2854028 RepID=A0A9Q3AEF3_9PSED|nr:hypothetical protein [Pseudomonas aegrilactucae]MBV6287360.1 hypothetical protein [Pseudomonas aegrilactucae]